MATKPADFFIGVVEFFSIVLPGALLSFLFLDFARQNIFGKLMPTLEGPAANWIAFALASYLLGHFASLVGARVLDSMYDWTYVKYKRRKGDHLYEYALDLKAKSLGARKNIANAYKWARANARQRSASGMQEIDRLEADSKFFSQRNGGACGVRSRRGRPRHCLGGRVAFGLACVVVLAICGSAMEGHGGCVPLLSRTGNRTGSRGENG